MSLKDYCKAMSTASFCSLVLLVAAMTASWSVDADYCPAGRLHCPPPAVCVKANDGGLVEPTPSTSLSSSYLSIHVWPSYQTVCNNDRFELHCMAKVFVPQKFPPGLRFSV